MTVPAPHRRPTIAEALERARFDRNFVLLLILLVLPLGLIQSRIEVTEKNLVGVLCLAGTGLVTAGSLYASARRHAFSVEVVHWIYVWMFLFLSPAFQIFENAYPFQTDLGNFGKLSGTACVVVFVYAVCYVVGTRLARPRVREGEPEEEGPPPRYGVLFAFSILSFLLLLAIVKPSGLIRRGDVDVEGTNVIAVSLIAICRAVAWMSFYAVLRRGTPLGVLLGLGVLAGMCNFPLAIPRFWLGALGVAFLAHFVRGRARDSIWLVGLLLFGTIYVFPALTVFRRGEATQGVVPARLAEADPSATGKIGATLTGADFDSFPMVVNSIAYADSRGADFGRSYLGIALFFVPRSLWKEKPMATPAMIASGTFLPHSNLSTPFAAEAMMNFGYAGVPLIGLLTGWGGRTLDAFYWRDRRRRGRGARYFRLVYPTIVGLTLILNRGALIAIIAVVAAALFAAAVVTLFAVPRARPSPT